ncbi:MAG: hypothetical protein E7053_02120 [Lentisphaerae bacterium]|nr:hypothetical protein [Lentisphaerota bacterium]
MKAIKLLSVLLLTGCFFTLSGGEQTSGASASSEVPMCAILTPEFRITDPPEYLAGDFHAILESSLIRNKVRVHNMQSVQEIMRRNRMPGLRRATPAWYSAIGQLLQVKALIQSTVTRFEVIETPFTVSETGYRGIHRTGFAEGAIRVIATHTGEVLCSIPFRHEFDFRQLDRQVTRNWQIDDYYRYMNEATVAAIVPELLKVPELTGK